MFNQITPSITNTVMVMEVPGKRKIQRPKRRWLDNIKNDLLERELSGEEAQDRAKLRRLVIFTLTPYKRWKGCRRRRITTTGLEIHFFWW